MHIWGKFWTARYKKTKANQLPLLKSQEQKQGVRSRSRILHMPPAHNTTKGVVKSPRPPLQPDPWIRPYPHPI